MYTSIQYFVIRFRDFFHSSGNPNGIILWVVDSYNYDDETHVCIVMEIVYAIDLQFLDFVSTIYRMG